MKVGVEGKKKGAAVQEALDAEEREEEEEREAEANKERPELVNLGRSKMFAGTHGGGRYHIDSDIMPNLAEADLVEPPSPTRRLSASNMEMVQKLRMSRMSRGGSADRTKPGNDAGTDTKVKIAPSGSKAQSGRPGDPAPEREDTFGASESSTQSQEDRAGGEIDSLASSIFSNHSTDTPISDKAGKGPTNARDPKGTKASTETSWTPNTGAIGSMLKQK
jgi:hypothetical protein